MTIRVLLAGDPEPERARLRRVLDRQADIRGTSSRCWLLGGIDSGPH